MATLYLVLVVVLVILAISDLIVGVSNDAVNFLNSAIGARVASMRTVFFIAGIGVLVGASFSGGMMEVARKSIFHPEYFTFAEIMIIFIAVMITDIILLDTFNLFGMPTSTTVSIVFELLGAAVGVAFIKISRGEQMIEIIPKNGTGAIQKVAEISDYINTAQALKIIAGILLSVVVAFSVGMIIQALSRLIFSFDFKPRLKYYGGLWGGFALSCILYFILIKGAKGAAFMSSDVKAAIKDNTWLILGASFIFWTILLQVLTLFTKVNILKLIVLVGTFALAMAFAGNDLVNFIGVPLAGYNSYEIFMANGGTNTDFLMEGMAKKVPTPVLFLVLSGLIMVLTLWLSKKARKVIKTSLDLSRQEEGVERFGSSLMARSIVRATTKTANKISSILPAGIKRKVETSFDQKPFQEELKNYEAEEAPVFDLLRAAVTLVVASILISIGTSYKLPLSTTYVTFMVAMGTSLADGAWGRESAVFRVSGVLSVIGGWFFTAFSAFTSAFTLACLFSYGGFVAIFAMILVVVFLLFKSHAKQKADLAETVDDFDLGDENSIDAEYIYSKGSGYANRLFESVVSTFKKSVNGLMKENVKQVQSSKNEFKKVFDKIKRVNNKVNSTIQRLDDASEDVDINYIQSMYFLHEIALSNNRIIRPIYGYVSNSHKSLHEQQLMEIESVVNMVEGYYAKVLHCINSSDYSSMPSLLQEREDQINELDKIRKQQVRRIKKQEVGTRNSVLFFDIMSESRHLFIYAGNFLEAYEKFYSKKENLKN